MPVKKTIESSAIIPAGVYPNDPFLWLHTDYITSKEDSYTDTTELKKYIDVIIQAGWNKESVSTEEWQLFCHWFEPHLANNQKTAQKT